MDTEDVNYNIRTNDIWIQGQAADTILTYAKIGMAATAVVGLVIGYKGAQAIDRHLQKRKNRNKR